MLLPLQAATALGLITHELVTNAFKHAFPGGRLGRIEVELREAGAQLIAARLAARALGKRLQARTSRGEALYSRAASMTMATTQPPIDTEADAPPPWLEGVTYSPGGAGGQATSIPCRSKNRQSRAPAFHNRW